MNLRLFQTFHLVNQHAQIGLARQQLQQAQQANRFLQGIQLQLEQQRVQQQHQALLQQVLFETDRAARDISGLAMRDSFAAAIHSRMRLDAVQGIDASHFQAFEHKKVWSDSIGALSRCWRDVEQNPHARDLATRFLAAAQQMNVWQRALGPQPDQRLQQLHQLDVGARQDAKKAKSFLLGAVGALGASILMTIILSAATDAGGCGGPFIVGSIIAIVVFLQKFMDANNRERKAQLDYEAYRSDTEQFGAFMQNPHGGRLLEEIATKHPAVLGFDPSQNPPPSSGSSSVVERHVVERQVVVTRCRYCGALTPVDLAGCQNCGATLGQ